MKVSPLSGMDSGSLGNPKSQTVTRPHSFQRVLNVKNFSPEKWVWVQGPPEKALFGWGVLREVFQPLFFTEFERSMSMSLQGRPVWSSFQEGLASISLKRGRSGAWIQPLVLEQGWEQGQEGWWGGQG